MHLRDFPVVLALAMCFAGISFGAAMTITFRGQSCCNQSTSTKSLETARPKKKEFRAFVRYPDHVGMRCKKWSSSSWRHHVELKPNDCDNTRWSDHRIKSFQWNFVPFADHFKQVWPKKDCKGGELKRLDKSVMDIA
ncbi:hypothetical protein AC579_7983 [Pseudocercospora musae]|uniref:Uncharacterized protein n=1 Tax=Pseudocercospora musae TaxID=113226 RepID=A0A139I043_9PEZI|nr:hypothetical protein AC579_7983 [Pseudocercospora musae]